MRSPLFHMALCSTALALACSGCSADKQEAGHQPARSAAIVTGARSAIVTTVSMPETVEVVGTVRARTSALVSTRIPGTVSVLRVREGDRVKKGQLLAQLDARENQATAAAASAGIVEAQRGLDETQARKKLADTTFDRYQRLFNEQAVTRQELDVKQSEREVATQSVARAEAHLKQAREGSRAASTMADYTRISAPISGIITSRQIDLGATVFPAQPLMTIEDEGSYQLELAIPESMASKVRPGMVVQVSLEAVGAPFSAKIAELVPAADPGSRTFNAKINLGQKGIKTGMFGRGTLALDTSQYAILVSKAALVERGALTSVWTLGPDNIAHLRLVKVGKAFGDRVEIIAGLSEGERVVVSGVEKVTEGSKVE